MCAASDWRDGLWDRGVLAAYEYMKGQSQDRELIRKLRHESLAGMDIVGEVVRLCAMNLYLYGIGNGGSPVQQRDSLATDLGQRYKVILNLSFSIT